jgi:predicted TIM-barrel fold metal-dependent hydrolase
LPRSVKDPSGTFETIYVDGQTFRRDLAKPKADGKRSLGLNARPVGTEEEDFIDRVLGGNDPTRRLRDLDDEGIWAEVIYPSLGVWSYNIRTPEVARAACRVLNEFALDFQSNSPRFVCCASIPLLDIDDAVAEVAQSRANGFAAAFLPTRPPIGRPDWHDVEWDPLWDVLDETSTVIGFHIGTEPHELSKRTNVFFTGRGGAVLNYVETTYGGQRAVTQLVASGVLERHPGLRVLVSEGGATWGPFIADRMDEGYRQHGAAVKPTLPRLPSTYIYEQIYASFQHDRSAVLAHTAMGWDNVMWGSV